MDRKHLGDKVMTEDEIIAVVTAHKEGKTIQFKPKAKDYPWKTISIASWDFRRYDYRIKPEPREYWAQINYLVSKKPKGHEDEYVRVREVLDEEGE